MLVAIGLCCSYTGSMSAQHIDPISINLLPKDAFAESLLGRTLEWALTVGRFIVIVTELFVIATFFQRFDLDRRLTNLNEDIYTNTNIIDSFSSQEERARQIQAKGEFIAELEDRIDILEIVDFLNTSAPGDISFDSITVVEDRFVINGIAFSRDSLEEFTQTLTNYPGVVDVVISNIEARDQSNTFDFGVSMDFDPGEVEREEADDE